MATYIPLLIGNGWQFFGGNTSASSSNIPLAGGLVYCYQAGTSNPVSTYTDYTGGTPNAYPIVLNSDGRPPFEVWVTAGQSYKVVLQDSLANIIRTWDNLPGINDGLY